MTDLASGERVSKSDTRVKAYGAVDEANAIIGLVVANMTQTKIVDILLEIQADLFIVGAELAGISDKSGMSVSSDMVGKIENIINEYSAKLDPLANFILPGGGIVGSHLHTARAVIRRAETYAVSLDSKSIGTECLAYLNRVSDLFFVLARYVNADQGIGEHIWNSKDTL